MTTKKTNQLLVRFLLGILQSEEEQQLQDWRQQSAENERFFQELCEAEDVAQYYPLYQNLDEKQAYQIFLKRTGVPTKVRPIKTLMKYAAVAVVCIALALPAYFYWHKQPVESLAQIDPGTQHAILITENGEQQALDQDSVFQIKNGAQILASNQSGNLTYKAEDAASTQIKYNTLKVPRGGEYRVTLADGTRVHLNAASELRYPTQFGKGERNVYLKGEGYFEIAKDQERPFYVHINDIRVKQYGTAFNVNGRSEEKTQVALVHGSVSVLLNDADKKEFMLNPSQLAEYKASAQSVQVSTVDLKAYVAWNEGKFVFEDKPLYDIMETLSLWYAIEVNFVDEDLKAERFTGNLERDTPIQQILEAIAFATDAKFSVQHRTIYIDSE